MVKVYVEKYGHRLICVRYRYSPEKRKHYKKIELIIEESNWQSKLKYIIKPDTIVQIFVNAKEKEIRNQVKKAGGEMESPKTCMGTSF